jgi:hypothetical protein
MSLTSPVLQRMRSVRFYRCYLSPPVFRYLTLKYAGTCLLPIRTRDAGTWSAKSCMRSESLDKPRIFFGILRTTLSELVSFALPVLGPELKRQRYGEFPKKKQNSGTSLPSQSYADCTSTYSDHRIRRSIRVMPPDVIPAAIILFSTVGGLHF